MCIACWIPKATNTHSQYVIFIVFPLQHWLHERSSILRYTYIDCLVMFIFLSTPVFEVITFFSLHFPAKSSCALPSNPLLRALPISVSSLHHPNGEVYKLRPQGFWMISCLHPQGKTSRRWRSNILQKLRYVSTKRHVLQECNVLDKGKGHPRTGDENPEEGVEV